MLGIEHSILLSSHRAVYIDIAKVASSSIKATLAAVLNLQELAGNPHEVEFPRPPPADPLGAQFYPEFYTFAFVRNPWDRLVSCYRDKICGEVADFTTFAESGVARCLARFDVFSAGMSFTEFVRAVASIPDEQADEHFRSQADYLCNSVGNIAVDFVGRFERLEQDFSRVAHRIGLEKHFHLPHLQSAAKANPASFYTKETQELVAQRYARDVALFHYDGPSTSTSTS